MKATLLITLLTLSPSVAGGTAAAVPAVGREVGQLFPSVVLPDLHHGRPLALSQFRGKKVLLIEFASW